MMTKIGNMQKIMISLDIFAEEKSFLNWPENLPFFWDGRYLGHPVYTYITVFVNFALLFIYRILYANDFYIFIVKIYFLNLTALTCITSLLITKMFMILQFLRFHARIKLSV